MFGAAARLAARAARVVGGTSELLRSLKEEERWFMDPKCFSSLLSESIAVRLVQPEAGHVKGMTKLCPPTLADGVGARGGLVGGAKLRAGGGRDAGTGGATSFS